MNRNRLTIVLYHGVDIDRSDGSYNYRGKFVRPDTFERQLQYYKKHYSVLPLDEAVTLLRTGAPLPKNALVITFDDGYRNNYTYAYPLLKKYSLPATIFLTTDFVANAQPLWVDRLEYSINHGDCMSSTSEKVAFDTTERARLKALSPNERIQALEELEEHCHAKLKQFEGDGAVYAPLSWEEIKEMQRCAIMFGAHTKSHPILSTLDRGEVTAEIEGSMSSIKEHCDSVSNVFAYPNGQPGDQDEKTVSIVRSLNFSAALTTSPGHNDSSSEMFLLKRFTLDNTSSFALFVATVSGVRHIIRTCISVYAKRS